MGLMQEDANVVTTSLDICICPARKYGTSIGISAVCDVCKPQTESEADLDASTSFAFSLGHVIAE